MRHKSIGVAVLLALLLIACGSDPMEEPGAELEGIFVEPSRLELNVGETVTLQATVTGFGNRNVLYSSSSPRIATVNAEGLVTALRPGIVGITATSEAEPSLFDISLVTVTGTSPLATITSFTASPSLIEVGDIATLSWQVSGEDVAVSLQPDVGDLRNVTSIEVSPLEPTTYTLTASSATGSDQASVTVRVVNTTAPIAPDVCEGDYLVNSQVELATLTTCRVITGTLTIDQSDDIVDLTALANLEQVGSLNILKNDALTSLTGLENLHTITGSLVIGGEQFLIELTQGISKQKPFLGNDRLVSLQGLDNLQSINGALSIGFNDALRSLDGLSSLQTVGSNLDIFENSDLLSLDGLDNLQLVGGSLRIYDNGSVTSFSGLDELTTIGTRLDVFRNDALTSFDGLENLQSIGGSIYIAFNISLTSLAAIASLTNNDIGGEARIFDNDNLDCTIQNLQFTIVTGC